jgi:hypothetical protein
MSLITGLTLTLLAGISMGCSMWSIKWARVWKWGNVWFVYVIASLIIAPLILAYSSLPHLFHVHSTLTPHEVLLPFNLCRLLGICTAGGGYLRSPPGFCCLGRCPEWCRRGRWNADVIEHCSGANALLCAVAPIRAALSRRRIS